MTWKKEYSKGAANQSDLFAPLPIPAKKQKIWRIIVAGGREFKNYELLKRSLDNLLGNKTNIIIVSGTCRGADRLGEKWAKERGLRIKRFPADWDGLGRKAGHIRNEEMARYSDALVAFWDGSSPGTKGMIELADNKYKLHLTCG